MRGSTMSSANFVLPVTFATASTLRWERPITVFRRASLPAIQYLA